MQARELGRRRGVEMVAGGKLDVNRKRNNGKGVLARREDATRRNKKRVKSAAPCQLALGRLEDPKSVEKRMAQRGFPREARDDPRGVAEPLPSRPLVGPRAEQPLSHSDPHQLATASLERASKRLEWNREKWYVYTSVEETRLRLCLSESERPPPLVGWWGWGRIRKRDSDNERNTLNIKHRPAFLRTIHSFL